MAAPTRVGHGRLAPSLGAQGQSLEQIPRLLSVAVANPRRMKMAAQHSPRLNHTSVFLGESSTLPSRLPSSSHRPSRPRAPGVVAMANPRRVKMVAQQIRREVSEMLLFDKVVQDAMTPEHALGADKYLSSVATISEVEVSGDLQVAKVYVSVYGDERGQERAMAGLKALAGYVRLVLGRRMRLRFTPEVRFIQDDALERGSRVLSILSQLQQERSARERGEPTPRTPMIAPQSEEDELFDDFGDLGGSLEDLSPRIVPKTGK